MVLRHPGRVLCADVTFRIAPGECILLAGANGCGKTTLLRALAGPDAVLIPTGVPKVRGFTIEAFIRTGCYAESDWRGRIAPALADRIGAAMALLGLDGLAGRDLSSLSDGEFQKACIATALSRRAPLLLLDEPTAFLDAGSRIMVLEALRDVSRRTGTAVLFSSHDLADSLAVADRVFAFTPDGRFLASVADPADRRQVLLAAFPDIGSASFFVSLESPATDSR